MIWHQHHAWQTSPHVCVDNTVMHSDWQWYGLMQHSRLFILDDTPPDYRPLVQVIENVARNHAPLQKPGVKIRADEQGAADFSDGL